MTVPVPPFDPRRQDAPPVFQDPPPRWEVLAAMTDKQWDAYNKRLEKQGKA